MFLYEHERKIKPVLGAWEGAEQLGSSRKRYFENSSTFYFLQDKCSNHRLLNSLFKNIGIVVEPLFFDVWAVFSASMLDTSFDLEDCISMELLLLKVETFPPLLIRLLLGATILEKSICGAGTSSMIPAGVVLSVVGLTFFLWFQWSRVRFQWSRDNHLSVFYFPSGEINEQFRKGS